MTINTLYEIIKIRKKTMPAGSYVSSLFRKGKDKIIQKVGEEAIEVVIAAKNKDKKEIISEMADLWFHSLVLLAALGIKPEDILKELESRHSEKKKGEKIREGT